PLQGPSNQRLSVETSCSLPIMKLHLLLAIVAVAVAAVAVTGERQFDEDVEQPDDFESALDDIAGDSLEEPLESDEDDISQVARVARRRTFNKKK
ncbi:hypothetical protein BOX15_Mlig003877g1, partial [Macrostomum lignano]